MSFSDKKSQIFDAASTSSGFDEDGVSSSSKTTTSKQEKERHNSSLNNGNIKMLNKRIGALSMDNKQESTRFNSASNAGDNEQVLASIDDDKHGNEQRSTTSNECEKILDKKERIASSSTKKTETERLASSSIAETELCKNEQIASSSGVYEDISFSTTESIHESSESDENEQTEQLASLIDEDKHGNEPSDTTSNDCENLLGKNERPASSSLNLDNKPENKQSSDVDNNIYVESQRILVLFRHELEAQNEHNAAVTSFTRREICNGRNPSKQNYSDVPEHWKYLQNTVPLDFSPMLKVITEVIIVEKYADLAIGYNHFLINRPVAIFRDCFDRFNNLKLGDVIRVSIYKIYIHVEQPTIILTDFHAHRSEHNSYNFHQYESSVTNGLVKLSNFTFQVKEISRINQYRVLYCDFGGIIIPKKLCKILTMEAFSKSTIVGSIKYRLTILSETQCACWKLGHDFDIYQDGIVHAQVIDSKLHMVIKDDKKRRLNINTGHKNVRMVLPVADKKKKYALKYKCNWNFMKHKHGFRFAQGKKRPNVHKF